MGTTCVAVMPQRNVGEVQHVIGLFLRPSPPPLERTDQLAIEARVFILLPQRTCISLRLPCLMAPVLPVPQVLVADYLASHIGTATKGEYNFCPEIPYQDALAMASKDKEKARASKDTIHDSSSPIPNGLKPYTISSPLAITTGGSQALNSTRMVILCIGSCDTIISQILRPTKVDTAQ
jgi:hypothetical protein